MNKRLQARWAAIPGVIYPDETIPPKKSTGSTKRKPAPERYSPLYYEDPAKYTTRGKVRKATGEERPYPALWCSTNEAAAILEVSPPSLCYIAKKTGIEKLVIYAKNEKWGAHKNVFYARAQIMKVAAERAAKKAEVKINLQENALCWSCSKCIVVGRGLTCEAFGNSLYAGRVTCKKYQKKEQEQ